MNLPEWLSVKEAALACHVSERTVWRWVQSGLVVTRISDSGGRRLRLVRRGTWPARSDRITDSPGPGGPGADPPVWNTDTVSEPVSQFRPDPAVAAVLGALVERLRAVELELRELRGRHEELVRLLPPPGRPWWAFWRR